MLTGGERLPQVVADALRRRAEREEITEVVLVRGPAAISDAVRVQVEASGLPVDRAYGDDRFGTNRALLASSPDSIGEAVVASGRDFPDALVAGAASAIAGVDLWLVEPDGVPEASRTAMTRDRQQPAELYVVVGGRRAVSDDVVDQLESLDGRPEVDRAAGQDRWETAVVVAEEVIPRFAFTGDEYDFSTVILTRGDIAPDAIVGSQLAGTLVAPMVLTIDPDRLGPATEDFLRRHAGQIERIVVLGDETAVTPAVAEQARRAAEGR